MARTKPANSESSNSATQVAAKPVKFDEADELYAAILEEGLRNTSMKIDKDLAYRLTKKR